MSKWLVTVPHGVVSCELRLLICESLAERPQRRWASALYRGTRIPETIVLTRPSARLGLLQQTELERNRHCVFPY